MSFNPKVSLFKGDPQVVDYINAGATSSGAVVIINNVAYFASQDIAAGALGALAVSGGVWQGNKASGAWTVGDFIYWNATGSPNVGTASTGAFTNVAGGTLVGVCVESPGGSTGAATADQYGYFFKTLATPSGLESTGTVAVGGTAIGNANAVNPGFNLVTGADNTAAVILPASSAGLKVTIKSSTSGKILCVFPQVGSKINGAAANAVYNHANLALRTYYCYNATDWFTAPETPT